MNVHHIGLYTLAILFASCAISFGLGASFDIWRAHKYQLVDRDGFTVKHTILEKALIVLFSIMFSFLCVGNATLIAQYTFIREEFLSFGFASIFVLTSIL
ncbi:hypothetical protein A3C17_03445 [Candidatus Uhrbacteria bacterium RIFCSPHIGHO2_02_FULL_53_13]|uniref:Uncharacterized protein n=1 Tax=Candidatus Uhrbacteria bacterium RIFCSPHIGHO2_02_FULL_53_13 TaxID=1802389 RepID=A0A1F7TWX7_9BACT|nr:MAG: hypothetical protein A3C17_03445 [Candidatus Uhrbacteria bacterium RIFCSPHIGHO2_02_FULL_53_13]